MRSAPFRSAQFRAVVLVASSGVLASTLGLGVRLMQEATAFQIVFYRAVFQATAVSLLVAHRSGGRFGDAFGRIGWTGLIGALALAITYNGMVLALTLTSVAAAVFILSAAPLLAGLLGWLVLGERMQSATLGVATLALIGIGVMVFDGTGPAHWLGNLAAALAALGYAVFTVALRKGKHVDMLPTVALSGVLAALMSAFGVESFAMTAWDLMLCAYLGACALALALVLFVAGSRALSAAELPLVAMTETVLAPLWVWLAFGERVGAWTLFGGSLVMGALLLQGVFAARRDRMPLGLSP